MSASSHSITLFKPMELKKIDDNEYALGGTPADCIKVALCYIFPDIKFDMVISGVNNGPNMGDDIFYSGTVAGAREGSMNELFSIAASLDGWQEKKDFEFPADFLSEFVGRIDKSILKENLVLNINFPNVKNPKGVRVTHLGERIYRDFITFEENNGKTFVTIKGDDPGFHDKIGSDLNMVSENYISITPMVNEVFDNNLREKIRYIEDISWTCLK